ncbi:MAG TPA: type III pantothenate kinase [Candidatus Brocadiia bacterium]|nr:type III pantothenate kinase [Candidatus Brocadiia bacterium]
MNLLADIGNSTIALALHDGEKLGAPVSISLPFHKRSFLDAFSALGVRRNKTEKALIASVNPPAGQCLTEALVSIGVEVCFMRHDIEIPIRVKVKYPEKVGMDRVLNALAAKRRLGSPVAVISYGTATVCDLVGKNGDYLGGTISPGAVIGMRALHERTCFLPEVEIKKPGKIPGKDTISAIQGGIFWSAVGGVRQILQVYSEQLGRQVNAVATGGMAELFAGQIPEVKAVVPALTLEGICVAAGLPL